MPADETVRVPSGRASSGDVRGGGDLTEGLLAADTWTDEQVAAAGIPVVDVPFVTVGGGIGSFVTFDYLRIAGVPKESIRVLGNNEKPWSTYEYLTRNSQIPRGERLRSDSASTPDNIWGFPSYAVREALAAKGLKAKVAPLWNVLTEPIFSNYYTPKAGQAFESMERETARVGYFDCLEKGLVRMVRKRVGGGYFTIFTPPEGTSATRRIAYRSRWVHIAVGYPGLKFLDDLQSYRDTYQDYSTVVNAYEPHEGVYEELRHRPGTVVIRGSGIVASRILQRLIDDRDKYGLQTQIVHVFRTYVERVPRSQHRDAPPRRRRVGLPGLQLPEVGLGRAAEEPDAAPRGRGAGRPVQDDRRDEHPGQALLAGAAAPVDARRVGTGR